LEIVPEEVVDRSLQLTDLGIQSVLDAVEELDATVEHSEGASNLEEDRYVVLELLELQLETFAVSLPLTGRLLEGHTQSGNLVCVGYRPQIAITISKVIRLQFFSGVRAYKDCSAVQ
jgi:hypothetical protein